jgi:hypothetical protein
LLHHVVAPRLEDLGEGKQLLKIESMNGSVEW